MEFRKTIMMTIYARQQKRHRCKEQTLDYVGEGEGRMMWKNDIETCILPNVKWMTSASSMHGTGHSKLVLWHNLEGWGMERGGRVVWDDWTHVHPWLIHVSVWQKPPQYCKAFSLQLK